MKKIFAILLVLSMVFVAFACTATEDPATDEPVVTEAPAVEEPVTEEPATEEPADITAEITLWTYPIGSWKDSATVEGFIASFNAMYPNITVKVEYLDYSSGDD
ncbi:MAG TPA: hypothetical protein PLM48_04305 [Clostridia bacterium]|nr:hypothetical protein [Clostridia bacterium]